jgi:hypothetical protein
MRVVNMLPKGGLDSDGGRDWGTRARWSAATGREPTSGGA